MKSIANHKKVALANILNFLERRASKTPALGINPDLLKPADEQSICQVPEYAREDFNTGDTDNEDLDIIIME